MLEKGTKTFQFNRIRILLLFCIGASLGFLRPCAAQNTATTVLNSAKKVANAEAKDTKEHGAYNYLFGSSPFLPSEAQTDTGKFISPDDFPTAAYCGKCHADAYHQWRESAHANSFREPFYVKNVDMLIHSKGIEFSRHCEGCHNPMALFSGALTTGSKINRSFDEDGLTCSVCHSIVRIQNTSGTGSYVMGRPAVMLNPDGTPRRGLPSDREILSHPELHRRAVMRDFYKSPEFCASCHKAALPRMLNGYKWLRAFSVYDEWQQSAWSRESPLPFYKKEQVSTCQSCHMPMVRAADDYGAEDGKIPSHRWAAANTAIPVYYGYTKQLEEIKNFLQQQTLGIDLFALQRDAATPAAPLGSVPFVISPNDDLTISIVIQNKGIGHSLVPEQRDFFESWVQLSVSDSAGKTLFRSGELSPAGNLDPEAHSYTNRLVSENGELLQHHEVWQTRAKAYDNTIGPGRSDLVRYRFHIPADARGAITLDVRANYRHFRKEYTDFVLGTDSQYPVVTMAEKKITLTIGKNNSLVSDSSADAVRWNNYGIALLDQQQYAAAAAAFQHVVELQPAYADGYVNIGVANYLGENYVDASRALLKAIKLSLGYPRALYYLALLDRRAGRLDAAAKKLRAVEAAFPRFRDAFDALGDIAYIQKNYSLARDQYLEVQKIDPDDLSAHHHLSLIYTRLGMTQQAMREAQLFNDERDDPYATTYAEEFYRQHPEMARESLPSHVHSNEKKENAYRQAQFIKKACNGC